MDQLLSGPQSQMNLDKPQCLQLVRRRGKRSKRKRRKQAIKGRGEKRKWEGVGWDGVKERKERRRKKQQIRDKKRMKIGDKNEEDERRAEKETRGKGWWWRSKGNDLKGEEGKRRKEKEEVPPPSADKRQKWMNPIGRRASSSFLSPRLHELRTHFIEICEIRKAVYRVIYHHVTPDHISSWLHNKIHNWHFFFGSLTTICCGSYKAALAFSCVVFKVKQTWMEIKLFQL